jgi:hypothetical protein
LDNWEQQLRPRAAFLKGLFWTIGNHHYGREAAAFLNWAIIGNNSYSREAAAFLKATDNNNYGREAAAFLKAK